MEGSELPSKFRQWIFDKPMVNDCPGTEQFELRELPISGAEAGARLLVRVEAGDTFIPARGARMANGMTQARRHRTASNYALRRVLVSGRTTKRSGKGTSLPALRGWQDYQNRQQRRRIGGITARRGELLKALNGTNSQWKLRFQAGHG